MTAHTPHHEELLAGLLLADVAPADRAELEACEVCRGKLAELSAVQGTLDELAAKERAATLSAAQAGTPAPGEDRAEETMARLLSGGAPAAKRPIGPKHLGLTLVAAAASLLVTLGLFARDHGLLSDGSHGILLSTPGLSIQRPVGEVEAFPVFEWTFGESDELTTYRLRIWDAEGGGGEPRITIPDLTEPQWTPTDEERRSLPKQITVRVDAFDSAFEVVDSDTQSASRP